MLYQSLFATVEAHLDSEHLPDAVTKVALRIHDTARACEYFNRVRHKRHLLNFFV